MGLAVCFRCATVKEHPFQPCAECGTGVTGDKAQAVSLALSWHFSSETEIWQYAYEIRNKLKVSIPPKVLGAALKAIAAPARLTVFRSSGDVTTVSAPDVQETPIAETSLHASPFVVLGASMHDDRKRLVELSEERSLEVDPDACIKARSDLSSPRLRLAAEMGWLPGVSPDTALAILRDLVRDPRSLWSRQDIPTLAFANTLSSVLELSDGSRGTDDIVDSIIRFSGVVNDLKVAEVQRHIHRGRARSGFPEVTSVDIIETGLAERLRHYKEVLKAFLDCLPSETIVDVMTEVVDRVTGGGERHGPALIDQLVDSYSIEVHGFLEAEAISIAGLVERIKQTAGDGEDVIQPLLDELGVAAKVWDRVAQPIQVNAKSRFITHAPSHEMAMTIRDLALELFNKHDMHEPTKWLTELGRSLFAELPDVVERLEQDSHDLLDVMDQKRRNAAETAAKITYRVEIGLIFKEEFKISPEGISWKGRRYPLASVTSIRWGGTRHSSHGVPTGSTYTIAFGNPGMEGILETRRQDVFAEIVDKLLHSVGFRLMQEMLDRLKTGGHLSFGEMTIHDDGIVLVKRKMFGGRERFRFPWNQIRCGSVNGEFVVWASNDDKFREALPYITTGNVHLLQMMVTAVLSNPAIRKVSQLFERKD